MFQSCVPGTAAGVDHAPVTQSARALLRVLFPTLQNNDLYKSFYYSTFTLIYHSLKRSLNLYFEEMPFSVLFSAHITTTQTKYQIQTQKNRCLQLQIPPTSELQVFQIFFIAQTFTGIYCKPTLNIIFKYQNSAVNLTST